MTERAADAALGRVLQRLAEAGYDFVMPTLATHALVAERHPLARPGDLRDIFGWTRPFEAADLPPDLLADLRAADIVEAQGSGLRLTLRVSCIEGRLHFHSADNRDPRAVFLGPDSYRFVRLIRDLEGPAPRRALEIGTGAGAGALAVAARWPDAEVIGADINPHALRLAALNARHARLSLTPMRSSGLDAVAGEFDLIIANPPYIAGQGGRAYRDGGGLQGAALAIDWVKAGFARLTPGGRFVLYTGAPIIEGRDVVRDAVGEFAGGAIQSYEELDPDIFGGLLRQEAYRDVERIAAIGLVLSRS